MHSMWCTIYQLYKDGQRLPPEVAQANGAYGWLYMYSKVPGTGMPKNKAYLLPEPGAHPGIKDVIEPLSCCILVAIDKGSMRLNGSRTNTQRFIRQAWICVPGEKTHAT